MASTRLGSIIALIALCAGIGKASGLPIRSLRADLDRDGVSETVTITSRARRDGHPVGGDVTVSRKHVVWKQRRLNPWKLEIADLTGDGSREVVVGVWKKSPRDPVMAKRCFIYGWDGKRLLPMWLGSRLSRRFDDFAVADIDRDGKSELISLEVAPEKKHRIAAYRWSSFGFEWLGCTEDLQGVTALTAVGKEVLASTSRGRAKLRFSGDKLQLTHQQEVSK